MREFDLNTTKIFVGKSAIDNTELVNLYSGTSYTWFHLHDLSSSHLVIEKNIKDLTDEEKDVCSNLVKYYSKYKKEWTKKYWVNIVCVDNVKTNKTPGLVTITDGKKFKIKPNFNFNPDNYNIKKNEK
tara:strand:+ start:6223 stop:6606 length:384 start_codon:yes stop_codon:yes gene_type:complete